MSLVGALRSQVGTGSRGTCGRRLGRGSRHRRSRGFFFGFGENYGDVGEDDTAFGHTDAFNGLKTADGEIEGAVAGEADVFGSENHHPAGDELGSSPLSTMRAR